MLRDGNAQKSIIGATPNEMHSYAKTRYLQWHNQNLLELISLGLLFFLDPSLSCSPRLYLFKQR